MTEFCPLSCATDDGPVLFEVVLEIEAKAGRTLDAGSRKLSTLNDTKLDVAAIEGKGSLVNTIDEPLVHVTGGKKARQRVPCSLFSCCCGAVPANAQQESREELPCPYSVSHRQRDDREMLLVLLAASAAALLEVVVCHVTVLRHPRSASVLLSSFARLESFHRHGMHLVSFAVAVRCHLRR